MSAMCLVPMQWILGGYARTQTNNECGLTGQNHENFFFGCEALPQNFAPAKISRSIVCTGGLV